MRKTSLFLAVGMLFGVLSTPAALAAASIRISPNTNLVNGQSVAVQGGGFAGDDKVVLHECTRTETALVCDYRKAAASDTYGRLNGATMKVFNTVNGIACSNAQPCFVRAKDTHGNKARASLSFGKY